MDAKQINTMIVNLQVRLLDRLRYKIECHYINDCVDDFTEEQKGFESGLRTCLEELRNISNEVQRPNPERLPGGTANTDTNQQLSSAAPVDRVVGQLS